MAQHGFTLKKIKFAKQELATFGMTAIVCLILTVISPVQIEKPVEITFNKTFYHSSGVTYLAPDDPMAQVPVMNVEDTAATL